MRNIIKHTDTAPDNDHYAHIRKQVTQLGLDFSLVTQWTSFIAVSEKIYNKNPESTTTQAVPLPQVSQVSAAAYATPSSSATFTGHGTPEPGVIMGLILILLAFLGFSYYGQRAGSITKSIIIE